MKNSLVGTESSDLKRRCGFCFVFVFLFFSKNDIVWWISNRSLVLVWRRLRVCSRYENVGTSPRPPPTRTRGLHSQDITGPTYVKTVVPTYSEI